MLESDLNKEEIPPRMNNVFLQPTTFNLTSLNNSTIALNRKNNSTTPLQQQQRPRLSNLRSTWVSQQSIEEEAFAEDTLFDISIPKNDDSLQALEIEVKLYTTIATTLCLVSSFTGLFSNSNKKLNTLFLGQWLFLFAWNRLSGRSEPKQKISIATSLCMFVVALTHKKASLSVQGQQLSSLIATLLFSFVYRLTSTLHHSLQKSHQQHSEQVKNAIQGSLQAFSQRRHLYLSTVSQEIRDASLMVMATLEQFSPLSILSNTHELLSACSIAVPITSISAINTTIKQACHISSHLNLISKLIRESESNNQKDKVKSNVKNDFDVSELIQTVGDALAGIASKLGVHFVIYHLDNTLYYTNVIGDEDATKHALINLLRNILESCTPGACIELGLIVSSIADTPKIKVTFEIIQTASPAIPIELNTAILPNANFTSQLLSYIDGKMGMEDLGKNKIKIEISLELFPGTANNDQKLLLIEKPSQILEKQLSSFRFSNEPTLEDLSLFIKQLNGVKMILHAQEKSVFAKHLTSSLTSWNTDISHLPVLTFDEENEEMETDSDTSSITSQQPPISDTHSVSNRSVNSINNTKSKIPSPAIEEDHIHSIPPTFILIDDDVMTLEKKLRQFRDQPQQSPVVLQQRRHRRSKSRADVLHSTIAVIFFASLTNYKRVRDIIQWTYTLDLPPYMPRVVVVTKPAGPRRFLTALHTAWNNAVVEPQFIPIATSPLSPFVSQHRSPVNNNHEASASSAGSSQTPMLIPHEIPQRFSPGRRSNLTGMSLHSPSGLQIESEKGNYFFDNVATSRNNVPTKLSTSPLTATPSGIQSPMAPNTPLDIKRRLRSHSNTFPTTPRRLESGTKKPTPVPEEEEKMGSSMDSIPTNEIPPPIASSPKAEEEPIKPKFNKFNHLNKLRDRKKKDHIKSDKLSPPITVLIVEDNMINQAILSTWMKKHSIKFSVAADGKESVEKWKGGGFHLILMDIQLPVMDGLAATRMIRGIEKERKIGVLNQETTDGSFQSPVIIVALTASSLESDRQAALAAGCNDFLTKPVSLEWLEKKIMEWGCMQALIDFEGWRKWKKTTVVTKKPVKKNTEPNAAKEAVLLKEKESLVQRTEALLKYESRAIVLVGINKRRTSSTQEPLAIGNKDLRLTIPQQLEERNKKLMLLETSESSDSDKCIISCKGKV